LLGLLLGGLLFGRLLIGWLRRRGLRILGLARGRLLRLEGGRAGQGQHRRTCPSTHGFHSECSSCASRAQLLTGLGIKPKGCSTVRGGSRRKGKRSAAPARIVD